MDFSLSDETITTALYKALHDVKAGLTFVQGDLDEEDYTLIKQGDDETVDKLFRFAARELGTSLTPNRKKKAARSIYETMQSRRDDWIKVIQGYDGEPVNVKVKTEESGSEVGIDVDTPTNKPKAKARDDAAVVTASATAAAVKKEATDMEVDEPVKVKSEMAPDKDSSTRSSTVDAGTQQADTKETGDDSVKMKSEMLSDKDSPTKDANADEKQPVKRESEADVKKDAAPESSVADMDVDDLDKKESKDQSPKSSKKRKSDGDDRKTPRKKQKKTKSPQNKGKGNKKRKEPKEPTEAQMEAVRETLKQEFEEEKTRILDDLPEEYKNRWGQAGYAKWGKSWLPCLFISPYNVPPESYMRKHWMKMYENTKGRRQHMSNLVFWYGQDDPNSAFSFIPSKQITTYDQGVEKGYDKLPNPLQKKVDTGKKLSKTDKELIRGHEQLADDLLKQPDERANFDYTELHDDDDYIRDLAAGAGDSGDELISDDDDDGSLSSALSSSSSELESDSDGDEVPTPKAKKAKKPTKKPKKKTAPVASVEVEEGLSFAEDEVSSDDSKDEDVVLSDDESSSDDEGDADYIEKKSVKKNKASTKPKKKKEKVVTEKKKRGPRPKAKKEPKEQSDYARNRAQYNKFRQNKDDFLPLLPKWKAAIKDEDTVAINEVMRELLKNVDSMGAPFMEAYNISPLMTASKKVLRDKNADRTAQKKLIAKLGELYTAQKKLLPDTFDLNKLLKSEKTKRNKNKDDVKPSPKKQKRKDKDSSTLDRNRSTSSLPESQPSTAPATPVRRVHSQGSSAPRDSQSLVSPKPAPTSPKPSGAAKPASQKTEKASFSLSRLFNPKPSSSQPTSDVDAGSEKPASQPSVVAVKSLPAWMTNATPDDVGELPSEQVDRSLALEFFQATAECFPKEKVNREAIARELEAAVYHWSREQYRKEETYWPKLHAVVAAISGKRKPGTLVAAIMAGEYEKAMDVVTLSDDMLLHSFEGS